MASRTQLVCLCEGTKGGSIDPVFINRLLKDLKPKWLRPWKGSNIIRLEPCGNRKAVIERTPKELELCLNAGGDRTLMVWADCDDDCADGASLKQAFWEEAQRCEISKQDFDSVVFIFAKDRLENWIEFLQTGNTDESKEGPRVEHGREAGDAAKKLAKLCLAGKPAKDMPPSLQWSCKNWQTLVQRMTS